ncbi:hypothetical protein GCM10009715_07320 [Paeniglutamicibacter psychrophenolicus]|uniref:DUF1772 domain-containing protein n=1 Tax=Paeniglutamicibacter psychrophenolicus TaxID=257454 RepID=A0ABS4WF57_9MICC|nr:hypothetical protein [Paeniglutamicibacter psychrophenolicus]MBP2374836.1 hypothetical protein [Paeniglutamicibacter psychrophenolicus]
MRALVRILGGAAAGFVLFALLGYLGMHFDWLSRGVRLDWGGQPFAVMMPRAGWEFGAAIALTVVLAGIGAVTHLQSKRTAGVGAVLAAALVMAACVLIFGTSEVQQAIRMDPSYTEYPALSARVAWHGASSEATYAVIGVLGAIAWLGRRPAPAGPLHHDDSAAYRRPVQ